MFKLIKEIRSKEGILHFKRWEIFSSTKFNFSIYLHGIYKADQDLHLHNHPWNIATLILWGSYIEALDIDDLIDQWHDSNSKKSLNQYLKLDQDEFEVLFHYSKPIKNTRKWLNFGYRPRKHYHKILQLLSKRVYSLAVVWGPKSEWGYNVDGKEVHHVEYRKMIFEKKHVTQCEPGKLKDLGFYD